MQHKGAKLALASPKTILLIATHRPLDYDFFPALAGLRYLIPRGPDASNMSENKVDSRTYSGQSRQLKCSFLAFPAALCSSSSLLFAVKSDPNAREQIKGKYSQSKSKDVEGWL